MYQAAGFRPARPLGHTALPGVLTLRLRLDAPARPLAWAAAATSALLFGGALGLGVAMDALAAALGVGCVGVSAVLAATLTTVFVAGTPAGWAAARFGTWRVAAAGTALAVTGLLAAAGAGTAGFVQGHLAAAGRVPVSTRRPGRRRGRLAAPTAPGQHRQGLQGR